MITCTHIPRPYAWCAPRVGGYRTFWEEHALSIRWAPVPSTFERAPWCTWARFELVELFPVPMIAVSVGVDSCCP